MASSVQATPKPGHLVPLNPKDESVFGRMSKEDAEQLRTFMRDWPIMVVRGRGLVVYYGSTNSDLVLEDRQIYFTQSDSLALTYTGSCGAVYRAVIKPGTILFDGSSVRTRGEDGYDIRTISGAIRSQLGYGGVYSIRRIKSLTPLRKVAQFSAEQNLEQRYEVLAQARNREALLEILRHAKSNNSSFS